PDESQKKEIIKNHPKPLVNLKWQGQVLYISSNGDFLPQAIADHYKRLSTDIQDPKGTNNQWIAYNKDIEEWLLRSHKVSPILIAIKFVDEEYSTIYDNWHEWSIENIENYLSDVLKMAGDKRDALIYTTCFM